MEGIMGPYVTELREDAAIIAVVGVDQNGVRRVRRVEPAPGDALGPGQYLPFITVSILSAVPEKDVPLVFATLAASCYGENHQNAWAVYQALVTAAHRIGPRVKDDGLAIYRTLVTDGGGQERDPDTQQPVVRAVIELIAATLPVGV